MSYLELTIRCSPERHDVFVAEMAGAGFEGMEEGKEEVKGFIKDRHFQKEWLEKLCQSHTLSSDQIQVKLVADQNWNEIWERSYDPVYVLNEVVVCSTFHSNIPARPFKIVIDPKRSFGTGHHETTTLMLEFMVELDFKNKTVLDFGCGTAILAIFAELKGSSAVLGIDIDQWAIENAEENLHLNRSTRVMIQKANIADIPDHTLFQVILANINKNVILGSLEEVSRRMQPDADLIMSGFFTSDSVQVIREAHGLNFEVQGQKEKGDWCAIHFRQSPHRFVESPR